MPILYCDCFSGISGDMLIGSLLDCGISFDIFQDHMAGLNLDVNLLLNKEVRNGISCSRFEVKSSGVASNRHLPDILDVIMSSDFSDNIKNHAVAVFNRLAAAEAQVHGIDINAVHFHEIGAVDTIIDVVGTFLCLETLAIDQVYSSPLPWAGGFVSISHGRYPLPAPATALLLQGVPCTGSASGIELVTPTGAALITHICSVFGPLPACIPQRIGYGSGSNIRNDGVPNLLRVIKADPLFPDFDSNRDVVAVIETEVDDLSPEVFSHLYALFSSNVDVLDFFTCPVIMKKNRPGVLITLLVRPESITQVSSLLMQQTGTLGMRHRLESRLITPRSQHMIDTPWGKVNIKVAQFPDGTLRAKPEYDDCHAIAIKHSVPLVEVLDIVNRIAGKQLASYADHYEP